MDVDTGMGFSVFRLSADVSDGLLREVYTI